MSPTDKRIAGQTDGKKIWLNREIHALQALGILAGNSAFLALNVLPHEVSHILSGVLVSETVEYFVEEFRAWTVGFVGLHGRLPTQYEALDRVSVQIAPGEDPPVYPSLINAWKAHPESFFAVLREIGFRDPQALVNLGYRDFMQVGKSELDKNKIAPQWGWPGFITNRPKP